MDTQKIINGISKDKEIEVIIDKPVEAPQEEIKPTPNTTFRIPSATMLEVSPNPVVPRTSI